MKPILQVDLKAIYQHNKDEIDKAIKDVLESGWYILGRHVEAFEKEFSEWTKIPHVVSVANGTDAVELSLRACGVGYGDRVATVSHTAVATVSAIERIGAIPVFVDIDPNTMTLCPNHLETMIKNIDKPPKAVVPVHIYGQMADMPALMDLSDRHSFYVIEDCAQAHGAKFNGKNAGSFGHLAAFSFYPTKNLGAFGDGGAIATMNSELSEKLRCLKQYGWRERNNSLISGVNSRMDEMQAAILNVLLKKLEGYNRTRQQIAAIYDDSKNPKITYPFRTRVPVSEHVFHQYVIRTKYRKSLQNWLENNQIQTAVHYPIPVHLQTAYKNKYPIHMPLTVTEQYAKEILSLPMNPYLSSDEMNSVAKALKAWNL